MFRIVSSFLALSHHACLTMYFLFASPCLVPFCVLTHPTPSHPFPFHLVPFTTSCLASTHIIVYHRPVLLRVLYFIPSILVSTNLILSRSVSAWLTISHLILSSPKPKHPARGSSVILHFTSPLCNSPSCPVSFWPFHSPRMDILRKVDFLHPFFFFYVRQKEL